MFNSAVQSLDAHNDCRLFLHQFQGNLNTLPVSRHIERVSPTCFTNVFSAPAKFKVHRYV